jgi:hypothetical protein
MPVRPNDDGVFLGPDDEAPNRVRTGRRRVERLRPLPGAYVRVPIQWLHQPVGEPVFRSRERLFLYVLYRSHWGQRGVALTATMLAEIGISGWNAYKLVAQLKRTGRLRVDRGPGRALVVRPVVLSG